MKLLQAFLILMIITTVSVLFLLTHPSVTTLPIHAIRCHHFQFRGTHRTLKNGPLSSSLVAKQHLSIKNHLENVDQFPGRKVAEPDLPRRQFPLTEIRPSGNVNAVEEHKETLVKAHTMPTLPHFPQFLQQHQQSGLQAQRDVAVPQLVRRLNNMLQRNMTEESYLEKKLPFHNWFQFPQPHAVKR